MENLRNARIESGHTQKSLATLLNISQQCYSDYENERTEPDLTTLSKIADLLNTSVDYLLGRSDDLGYLIVQNSPTVPALADDQKQLLDLYDRMTHQQKIRAIAYCEGLLSTSGNVSASRK